MKTIETVLRPDFDQSKVEQVKQIFDALITTGGLTGVRGGQTIIHFDADGNFQGVQLSYWPWRRRKV
jgi:hypothetical protein